MKIKDVAELLGVTDQTVRVGLQVGAFPFGAAFRAPGSKQYTYVLYPEKVREYCGQQTGKAE